ncbi:MAG TPA: prenyltransferase/squalene oxidase repeat-containing protein [Verrucomicrobiota bacterium]|nr:prenyltransferase/squalene oxidase repeat-containing protein [Verrucomicrobiota bacterium]
MEIDISRFNSALQQSTAELLSRKSKKGYWEGCLASSALSTATAVVALELVHRHYLNKNEKPPFDYNLVEQGIDWLAKNVNPDGGWGDTTLNLSNLSTTALCWSAFYVVQNGQTKYPELVFNAEKWIKQHAGRIEPHILVPSIITRYGNDRTFSAPILMMCAIAGRLGNNGWKWVPQLPFELAALPQKFYAAVKMPVVSYALPALVAIGQARYSNLPSGNIFQKIFRSLARERTFELIKKIQPFSGGYLEAVPLTSFVTMALASCGQAEHPVVKDAVKFITSSARKDGSWAIDTNLAVWLTTLSINAICDAKQTQDIPISRDDVSFLFKWILNQQYRDSHQYTGAPPGGWAWTNLSGGVPDADDTAGALLALNRLMTRVSDSKQESSGGFINPIKSAINGINWLINLQNKDGGIPTFCRGWGHLPFDRSGADLTAHAIRAIISWLPFLPPQDAQRLEKPLKKAVDFLLTSQSPKGYWQPLWFGNQYERYDRNLTYGTSRVLISLQHLLRFEGERAAKAGEKAVNWLINCQNKDGSWGGFANSPPSIEETAWAVESLARVAMVPFCEQELRETIVEATIIGTNWLIEKVESGEWTKPSPIGFYFANLWYYEELYPLIFTVSALKAVQPVLKTIKKTK